jgi:Bacteriocin-protection, YdeI or OmpD-Associated
MRASGCPGSASTSTRRFPTTVTELDPEASAAYERLSSTHREEYAHWGAEARRAATRQDRLAKKAW